MIIKRLFFCFLLMTTSVSAGVWQDQAVAFRVYGEQLENNEYPDYSQAYHFYCVSTAMNDSQAAFAIGNLYVLGHGVNASSAIAKGWFTYAARLGNQQAVKKLEQFQGSVPQEDPFCPKHDSGKVLNKDDIMAWVKIIAPAFGLDPSMVNAVISVESGFNPQAISKQNARGLMQLIPATAQRFGVQNSFDPVHNMVGGIAYLRYLLQLFSGDLTKTWAAYNAGENAVVRNKGVPPYEETIAYVRILLAMYPRAFSPVRTELPFEYNDKKAL
jgi:soluble lytic murein transglycosylase-like protein